MMPTHPLLCEIMVAGSAGYPREHIAQRGFAALDALDHLIQLRLVFTDARPYWEGQRVYYSTERHGPNRLEVLTRQERRYA